MKPSFVRALFVCLALPLVSGCLFNRTDINISDLQVRAERVVAGQTTVPQLEEILGGPATSITPIEQGKLLYVYTYGESRTAGLTLIVLNITKTNTAIDTALFLVNSSNVVEWKKIGTNTSGVRWQWWAFGDH